MCTGTCTIPQSCRSISALIPHAGHQYLPWVPYLLWLPYFWGTVEPLINDFDSKCTGQPLSSTQPTLQRGMLQLSIRGHSYHLSHCSFLMMTLLVRRITHSQVWYVQNIYFISLLIIVTFAQLSTSHTSVFTNVSDTLQPLDENSMAKQNTRVSLKKIHLLNYNYYTTNFVGINTHERSRRHRV